MITEAQSPYDPDERRREALVNGSGFSYSDAYARYPDLSRDDDTKEIPSKLPGQPVKMSRSGSVRDFHDGGRADEYRGDSFGVPVDEKTKKALDDVLPDIHALQDSLKANLLKQELETGRIDELGARARARAYFEKHGRDISGLVFPDDVSANQS